jgi:hypothetical protein
MCTEPIAFCDRNLAVHWLVFTPQNSMASQRLVDQRFPHLCPAAGCTKGFKTAKGLNTHLANARSCLWYRKGKLSELTAFTPSDPGDTGDPGAYTADEEDPVGVLDDFHREMFEFIPLHARMSLLFRLSGRLDLICFFYLISS